MRAALVRTLAIDTYARCLERRELADRALQRTIRAHPELRSNERRMVGDALYALVRHSRRLDHLLAKALAAENVAELEQRSTPDKHRLRFGAALVDVLEEPVSEAVALAGASGGEERVLARIAGWAKDDSAPWPTDPVLRLSTRCSVPEWFARRLFDEYKDEAEAIAKSLNERAPLAVRVNALLGTVAEARAKLSAEGVASSPGKWAPGSLVLETRTNVPGLDTWKSGAIEVQDEGSQCIAAVAGVQPGQLVVDACAGAGGKTLALAAALGNKGRIVACDVTPDRLEDVRPRAKRAKAQVIETRVVPDGDEKKLKDLKDRADVVLVDAPCSGVGAWRRNADGRWRMSESEAAAFPQLQRKVLRLYATLVKPGGRLVYATCSILRAENEEVVAVFLAGHPNFKAEPVTTLPNEVLDDAGRLKTLPNRHGTDGFFAAAFRRVK